MSTTTTPAKPPTPGPGVVSQINTDLKDDEKTYWGDLSWTQKSTVAETGTIGLLIIIQIIMLTSGSGSKLHNNFSIIISSIAVFMSFFLFRNASVEEFKLNNPQVPTPGTENARIQNMMSIYSIIGVSGFCFSLAAMLFVAMRSSTAPTAPAATTK